MFFTSGTWMLSSIVAKLAGKLAITIGASQNVYLCTYSMMFCCINSMSTITLKIPKSSL